MKMAKDNSKIEFLLTKHVLLNQVTLSALIDLKEELMQNNKPLYNGLRQNINKLISEQQAIHEIYKKIIPKDNLAVWDLLEQINDSTDKILLK